MHKCPKLGFVDFKQVLPSFRRKLGIDNEPGDIGGVQIIQILETVQTIFVPERPKRWTFREIQLS